MLPGFCGSVCNVFCSQRLLLTGARRSVAPLCLVDTWRAGSRGGLGESGGLQRSGRGSTLRGQNAVRRALSVMATPASSETVVAYCTVPDVSVGRKIAAELVSQKLAACVNMVSNVESTYVWEGEVQHDQEMLLIIKTKRALVDELSKSITQSHPYDLPEVIATPIVGGLPEYLSWIADTTRTP